MPIRLSLQQIVQCVGLSEFNFLSPPGLVIYAHHVNRLVFIFTFPRLMKIYWTLHTDTQTSNNLKRREHSTILNAYRYE